MKSTEMIVILNRFMIFAHLCFNVYDKRLTACVSGLGWERGHAAETMKSSKPRKKPKRRLTMRAADLGYALLGGVLGSHTLLFSHPTLCHLDFSLKIECFSVFTIVL
jgi:hypothetical protein